MIGKLALFMIVVKDMDRSVAFYRDVLGLKVLFQTTGWSSLSAGNVEIGLHSESEHLKVRPTESAQMAFYVDDIEKAVAYLKAHNTHVLMPPKAEEFGTLSVFTDPDGYHIQVCQLAAKSSAA